MMQIRELIPEDYEDILLLWKQAGFLIGKSDSEGEYVRFLRANPRTSLGVICDDQLSGAVLGGFDGRRGTIHHLVINEASRKLGYGKALMYELIRRFGEMGVVKLSLWVKTDNSQVIAFYEKLGFELRRDLYTMSYDI
ncbi:MAG TPA: GNAT family N-acetyltransferase [Thermotogota bacterium]|nr:GNAT family N-acetyltransferase [Thermotogota bacterium]HPJ88414.1 GNAT family N-acetyltransferase [Thermotogota bacterium]HPR95419.1 GNAT family N-acetyltransferase [Thermotogota bacterium]